MPWSKVWFFMVTNLHSFNDWLARSAVLCDQCPRQTAASNTKIINSSPLCYPQLWRKKLLCMTVCRSLCLGVLGLWKFCFKAVGKFISQPFFSGDLAMVFPCFIEGNSLYFQKNYDLKITPAGLNLSSYTKTVKKGFFFTWHRIAVLLQG